MSWAVVLFLGENCVEAVPLSWYSEEKRICLWPYSMQKKRIAEVIRKCESPGAISEPLGEYEVKFLGSYDNWKDAQRKAEKAEVTDSLSSAMEEISSKGRKRRKKVSRYSSSDARSSSSEDDDTRYPTAPKKKPQPVRPKPSAMKEPHRSLSFETFTPRSTPSASGETSNLRTSIYEDNEIHSNAPRKILQPRPQSCSDGCVEIHKKVLREVYSQSLKIDEILNLIQSGRVLQNKRNHVREDSNEELITLLNLLPLTETSLPQLEDFLGNENLRKAFVKYLLLCISL